MKRIVVDRIIFPIYFYVFCVESFFSQPPRVIWQLFKTGQGWADFRARLAKMDLNKKNVSSRCH